MAGKYMKLPPPLPKGRRRHERRPLSGGGGAVYPAAHQRHEEVRGMAKSKSASKKVGKGGASARAGARRRQPAPRVGKGKLEVGTPRRETGGDVEMPPAKRPLARAAAKRPKGTSSLQLRREKAVRPTDATVPVEPRRPAPGEREPMPAAAVDRRRHVVGTDDKPRRGGR
jgi:hypothetical protein